MSEVSKMEYWFCVIGPAPVESLPFGADLPMRLAVKEAFAHVTGHEAQACASGWGVDQEEAELMQRARHDAFMRRQGQHTATQQAKSGLTPDEQACMDDLVAAWNKFTKLPVNQDNQRFCDAMNQLQYLLGMRVLRRDHPEYWVTL
jgi:hypothetical protein